MRGLKKPLPHPGLTAGVLTVVSALETEVPPHPSRLAEKSNSCSVTARTLLTQQPRSGTVHTRGTSWRRDSLHCVGRLRARRPVRVPHTLRPTPYF
jgi:hypothetical protein